MASFSSSITINKVSTLISFDKIQLQYLFVVDLQKGCLENEVDSTFLLKFFEEVHEGAEDKTVIVRVEIYSLTELK